MPFGEVDLLQARHVGGKTNSVRRPMRRMGSTRIQRRFEIGRCRFVERNKTHETDTRSTAAERVGYIVIFLGILVIAGCLDHARLVATSNASQVRRTTSVHTPGTGRQRRRSEAPSRSRQPAPGIAGRRFQSVPRGSRADQTPSDTMRGARSYSTQSVETIQR